MTAIDRHLLQRQLLNCLQHNDTPQPPARHPTKRQVSQSQTVLTGTLRN
jgi:hypothetical protein